MTIKKTILYVWEIFEIKIDSIHIQYVLLVKNICDSKKKKGGEVANL